MRMKLNKKIMTVQMVTCLLLSQNAMAKISAGDRKTSTGTSVESPTGSTKGNDPSSVKVTEATKDNYQSVSGNSVSCNSSIDDEKYFPLSFFDEIARDDKAQIKFENKAEKKKILVSVPSVLNVCGQFVPEFRQDKNSKNITILMKLIGFKTEKVVVDGVETKKQVKVNLTHRDFENCLTEKGYIKEGKIDWEKIPDNGFTESITDFDYDFDKKTESQNSVKVTYGYPKSYDSSKGYQPKFGFDDNAKVLGEACMKSENVADKPFYINKGREALIQEINAICLSGTAQEIANARNTLGNADALKDIAEKIKAEMDIGYLAAVKKDVDQIYKNLSSIEDKILRDKDSMTEKKAKELVSEYADNLKKLDEIFLEKAVTRIDVLIQRREKMKDDSPEAKAADAEVKALNAQIGEFSKRGAGLTYLYDIMEKYATIDSAKVVEDIYLKSRLYSQVYTGDSEGRPKALSFEDAKQKQINGMKKFDRVADEWSDVYLVGKGNQYPAIKTQREAQAIATRMNTRLATFQKKEMEDYNSYCTAGMTGGMRNPTRCREFISGKQKREAAQYKKRETDLKSIAGKERKLSKMTAAYSEYDMKRNAMKDKEEYERYDSSSISGYEDDFSERFPGFSGSVNTAYDPSMYSMNGQAGMAPNPFMGQQQQMQFQQNPQIQQGGWPSMR